MVYIRKKYIFCFFLFVLILISGVVVHSIKGKSISANTISGGYVAIVIDDLGDYEDGVEELMSLNIPITVAVMPFLENTKIHTEMAIKAGFEVIIHLSMESENGNMKWLGPRPIKHNSSKEEIMNIMYDAIKEVKGAKGINNHMGSRVIKDKDIMTEILSVSKKNNLYFLDSGTAESGVAEEVAGDLGVVFFSRDVYLDNSKDKRLIKEAMNNLTNLALDKGYAIGLGHVGGQGGKATIDTITQMYSVMEEKGVKFIYVSDLIEIINTTK